MDVLNTETGIFTSLKSNFYFQYCRPPTTKSGFLNFNSTCNFMPICWKMW